MRCHSTALSRLGAALGLRLGVVGLGGFWSKGMAIVKVTCWFTDGDRVPGLCRMPFRL